MLQQANRWIYYIGHGGVEKGREESLDVKLNLTIIK